ncbi:MAG: chromosome partitioning protein ParB [Planctomyces sp.]|nr:chromosome partitioning protein ParB [Planctomyces sp.]
MDDQLNPEPSRRRLGRGLNALLGTGHNHDMDPVIASGDHSEVHIDLLERNPFQARKDFEINAITELADSIRQHGVLQPIIVRQVGDMYQVIAGERRLIAARKAGCETVPCRVLELTDQQVFEVSLEENLKRQDLNVLEKAQSFQEYLNQFQCSIEELSRRLSMDRSTVSNFIRLLDLAVDVQEMVRKGQLTGGHARAMLSLPHEQQITLGQQIAKEGLSVRKTEEAVRTLLAADQGAGDQNLDGATVPFQQPGEQAPPGVSNHILSLQEQLQGMLGAKVSIKLKGKAKDKGSIVIEFGSNDDFERILGSLQRIAA